MSSTPFKKSNKDFSDAAHESAKINIYPLIFKCSPGDLFIETTTIGNGERAEILDGQMAVDRIIKVRVDGLRDKIQIPFQERFREPRFAQYRDITITEWNVNSNLPSELYKIQAHYFLYGYYDIDKDIFIDVININVAILLKNICEKNLIYSRKINPRSNQPFITIKFDDLFKIDAVDFIYKKGEQSCQ